MLYVRVNIICNVKNALNISGCCSSVGRIFEALKAEVLHVEKDILTVIDIVNLNVNQF